MEDSNIYENLDNIVPSKSTIAKHASGQVKTTVKKLSWNVFRFSCEK